MDRGDMSTAEKTTESITFWGDQKTKINDIASQCGAISSNGKNAGSGTWQELIRLIASGHLIVTKPGQSTRYENKNVKGGKGGKEKTWKAWPKYPPKWWKPNCFGEVPIADCVSGSGRTEEELIAGGLEVMPGTRNFVGLEEWMKLAPEVPDDAPPSSKSNADVHGPRP